ncbi:MAG: ABC transporter substrate-binding protein, partial [Treponema sp.]|nr:ABC transporter substrate-binding protein [Treponema sp.]
MVLSQITIILVVRRRLVAWMAVVLLSLCLAPEPAHAAPLGLHVSDFAEIRPRPRVQDELVAAFSVGGGFQPDFRLSYLASEAQIFTALYEGLFSYHPLTVEPVAAAAQSWELSEDGREWTFTIRPDARFHNGDPLRAEDFRASWLSSIQPERNAPYASLFDIIEGAQDFRLGTATADNSVGIFTPDERTLVVRLNSPVEFFPSILCHHSFSPVHPSMLDEKDWAAQLPPSNGPFYLEEIDTNRLALAKNPHYWDTERVRLSGIVIRFVDGEESSALWNSGEVRWIQGDVDFETLMDRSSTQVNAMFATHYYFTRSARSPWDDFRLRRALALALPWDEIRHGHVLPAATLIFP